MGVCRGKAPITLFSRAQTCASVYCAAALLMTVPLTAAAQQGMGVNPGSDTSSGMSGSGMNSGSDHGTSGTGSGMSNDASSGTGMSGTGNDNGMSDSSNSGVGNSTGNDWNPRSRADTVSPSGPELDRPSGAPSNTAPNTVNQPRGTGNTDLDGRNVDDMADDATNSSSMRDRDDDYASNAAAVPSFRGSGHELYQASRYWLPDPGIEQGIGPTRFRNEEHWRVAGYHGELVAMDTSRGGATSGMTVATSADQDFIQEAYRGSAREVRLGYIALQRAGNDDVKDFARRMVADHGRAARELERIAAHSSIELDKGMDHEELLLSERLRELSGRDFDRVYMERMMRDHEDDIAKFRSASTGDSVTSHWAERTLPKLEYHHDAAVAIGTEPV